MFDANTAADDFAVLAFWSITVTCMFSWVMAVMVGVLFVGLSFVFACLENYQ